MVPLRFAILGCGVIAPTHAGALRQLGAAAARLVAVADVLPERARKLADEFGVARAYDNEAELFANDDVDAVILCTPSGLHAAQAVRALDADRHVVIEKPMDVTVAACDRVIAARRRTGKTVAVISQHRFDVASVRVKQAIEAGELGRIFLADMSVKWWRTQEYYDSGAWRGTWALDGGGALMNQGIHTVDLLLWLAGPVKSVYARALTAGHERVEVEDVVVATLTFASGAVGTLTASTACFDGQAARIDVYGTSGSAIIEGDKLRQLIYKGRPSKGPAEAASRHALRVAQGGTAGVKNEAVDRAETAADGGAWGDAHREQLEDFIDAVRAGRSPLVSGTEGRNAVALIRAVYESASTHSVVEL